jgi:hypothetical protein
MLSMRELFLGTSLLLALVLATVASNWRAQSLAPATTTNARVAVASPVTSGPGFTLCAADASWQRPSAAEQRAHLGADDGFSGTWETPATTGYREFVAPAVLYDGKSVDGLHWISNFTGLWNVWENATTRPKTCWTDQPQVFLFGYEALSYDAQDPKLAELRVRPAPGYRMVILTGPIRPTIAIVGDRKLDELSVPEDLVTPPHLATREGP